MKRQHPLKILSYSAKNVWLMIFPLIRDLFSIRLGDIEGLYDWFAGSWFDLIVISVILLTGYIRWQFSCFKVQDDALIFMNGIFFRTRKSIPLKNISAVTEEKSFYLRPFKAVRMIVNTRAGTLDEDLSLLVNENNLQFLRNSFSSNESNEDINNIKDSFEYKPKFWHTFFFSFIFSSTLSGAIYIFIFLFKSGSIIEQFLKHSVLDELSIVTENVANKLMLNVSPIFVGLSLIIAISWLISFITNIMRYTNFRIKKNSMGVFISTGVLTRRRYKIGHHMVNYADLCQNFLTKIFKFVSINVNCSGYGYKKEEIPVFIPIMNRDNCQKTISAIMPSMKIYPNNYKPKLGSMWRYIYPSLFLCIGILVGYYVSAYFFPSLISLTKFLTIMMEIPSVWFLVIRLISLFTSGFSLKDNQLCIRYSKGYTFHTILVSDVKITKVSIKQTIFQRFKDTYDIVFYLTSEQSKGHKVKGVSRTAIEHFL